MKNGWTRSWGLLAARIDALSLRERAFLFVSIIACGLALADVVWLSPAQLAHRQLIQRFDRQSVELQRARDELKTLALPVDATQAVNAELAALQARLERANQNIEDVMPLATQAAPLAQALIHFLRRHEGLTLVRTAAAAPDAPGIGAPMAGLTRQGVELTVSGPYVELMRYVQSLENALPQVRWGAMKLKGEKQTVDLTLQVFLVGVPP